MWALGLVFIMLPCLAVLCFTGFAACRAQRGPLFQGLAWLLLACGLGCVLVPVGMLAWLLFL